MAINFRKLGGGALSAVGTALNLPELGLSERLAGQPSPFEGGAGAEGVVANVGKALHIPEIGASERVAQATAPINPLSGPIPQGVPQPIQGPQPNVNNQQLVDALKNAGHTDASAQSTIESRDPGDLAREFLEPTPEFQEPAFDIQPALDDLARVESDLRGSLDQQIALTEQAQQGGLQAEAGQQELITTEQGQATEGVQQEAQGNISETQRQGSQIMQGIQSRFGGTTGTGKFASEILGAQISKNLASFRTASTNAVQAIDTMARKEQLQSLNRINQINLQAETDKTSLRNSLKSALAELQRSRTGLRSDKQKVMMNAFADYKDQVVQVNARNAQAIRQIAEAQSSRDASFARARTAQENKVENFNREVTESKSAQMRDAFLSGDIKIGNPAQEQAFREQFDVPAGITPIEKKELGGVGDLTTEQLNALFGGGGETTTPAPNEKLPI